LTAAERGLLLLCCSLGDELLPLTMQQYRALRRMVRDYQKNTNVDRELCLEDLTAMGCSESEARRILTLLGRADALEQRLLRWEQLGVQICTRLSGDYPERLRERLGDDAPPVLFLRGDRTLLQRDMLSVVGSRDLTPEGAAFAEEVGHLAAARNLVLVSGNARGADRTAQDACLKAGGSVIAIVADSLLKHSPKERVLYISEEVPEKGFSSVRALRRNRLIHAAGRWTFVAQVHFGSGGTWDGTTRNLRFGWSPVYVREDGSEGAAGLRRRGAKSMTLQELAAVIS